MKDNNSPLQYSEFWDWFSLHAKEFSDIINNQSDNIETEFFDKLSAKLLEIKDGFYFLVGVLGNQTIDLIFTAESNTATIAFVEDLVEAAPNMDGWQFRAHKPPVDADPLEIKMGESLFSNNNIGFYPHENPNYPDSIDIVFVHNDLTEENRQQIANGACVFLDNYLGELYFLNNIDDMCIIGKGEAEKEILPINELVPYLNKRQQNFIEKYENQIYNKADDNFSVFKRGYEDGSQSFGTINKGLLNWEGKVSHPWVAILTLKYNGEADSKLPNESDYELLNKIEDDLINDLEDSDGCLNIGRETGGNERKMFFACADFRRISKEFYKIQQKYSSQFDIKIAIYKDKYWQSFESFNDKKD